MPGEPVPGDTAGLRAANARLRAVVEAKTAEIGALRAELDAERELGRRQELRLAELKRRLTWTAPIRGRLVLRSGSG